MSELKPCPHCGAEATLDKWIEDSDDATECAQAVCLNCGCVGPGGERVAAIAAWNTRPDHIPREEADAMVASAYEDAAGLQRQLWNNPNAAARIMGRTPSDARAALDKMLAEARRVKPLEWVSEPDLPHCFDADGMGVLYRVLERSDGTASLRINYMNCEHSVYGSADLAKAFAQDHFARRVRSCLASLPGEGEG